MLAVPMVMEMAMESIFAVADVFWVAHLGADAVATVGLTESMLTMIYTAAMGLSIGATALVARRTGEQDPEGAARAAGQSMLLGLAVALAIAVVTAPQSEPNCSRSWAPRDRMSFNPANGFTRVMLGGNATVLLLFMLNAVFRGSGDAAIAMRVLWLGNILNIILGPCFIFGLGPFPRLGVTGAAVATNLGRGTAVACQLAILFAGRSRVRLDLRHLRLDLSLMRSVLRLSGSGTIQILIATASYIGLVRILSVFGSPALAGYTIGMRVIMFALLPAFGLSNAAATMVGQNLGARRPDRAERAVWTAALYNMVFLGTVGSCSSPARPIIAGFFTSDPEVLPYAIGCLRTVSLGFVFYAYGMVLTQAFNGAGDTWTPTVDQRVRVLAVGDPARLVALVASRLRRPRRVHGPDDRLLDARGRQRASVQKGEMEEDRDLIYAAGYRLLAAGGLLAVAGGGLLAAGCWHVSKSRMMSQEPGANSQEPMRLKSAPEGE